MNIVLLDSVSSSGLIPSTDRRAQHIIRVLRLKVGDTFILGQVNSHVGTATITGITGEGVSYTYHKTREANPLYPVTLLVGQVRPISMKRILREATMLGVREVIISRCELAEKSYESAKIYTDRAYEEFLLDGAMIAGDVCIPHVEIVTDLRSVEYSRYRHRFLLDNVIGSSPLSHVEADGETIIAVGPERGFSDTERALFIDHGFTVHSLGGRILRTETACPVALSLVLSRMGLL